MNSLAQYYIIYYVILFLAFLIGLISNSYRTGRRHYVIYILIVGLSLFVGSRSVDIGTDTHNYIKSIDNAATSIEFDQLVDNYISGSDPIFTLLSFFCSRIGGHTTFLTIVSFIMFFGIYRFAELVCKTEKVGSGLLLFFCIISTEIFLNQQFNIIRSGIAVVFFLHFSYSIYYHKYKQALLYGLIASGIHASFLIPISITLFVRFWSISLKYYYWLFLLSAVASFLGLGVHKLMFLLNLDYRQVELYLVNSDSIDYKIGFRPDFFIFNTTFLILFHLFKKNDDFLVYYIKCYILCSVLFFFWFYIPYSDRVGAYGWNLIPIILYMCYCKHHPCKQILWGSISFLILLIINLLLFIVRL